MLAGIIVSVANDDDDASRLDRFALHQLTVRARHVDCVVERRPAARLCFPQFLDDWLRFARCIDLKLSVLAVSNQITGKFLIVSQQGLDQLDCGFLIILPMNAAGTAEVDEEPDYYGLIPFTSEE